MLSPRKVDCSILKGLGEMDIDSKANADRILDFSFCNDSTGLRAAAFFLCCSMLAVGWERGMANGKQVLGNIFSGWSLRRCLAWDQLQTSMETGVVQICVSEQLFLC